MKETRVPFGLFALTLISRLALAQGEPAPAKSDINVEDYGVSDIVRMRDPFKEPETAALKKDQVKRTELQQFAASDFKLVGVISGKGHPRAMLVAPNNKTFFARETDKIGQLDGAIRKITPTFVQVEESVMNILGKKEKVYTYLRLPSETALSTVQGGSNEIIAVEGQTVKSGLDDADVEVPAPAPLQNATPPTPAVQAPAPLPRTAGEAGLQGVPPETPYVPAQRLPIGGKKQ